MTRSNKQRKNKFRYFRYFRYLGVKVGILLILAAGLWTASRLSSSPAPKDTRSRAYTGSAIFSDDFSTEKGWELVPSSREGSLLELRQGELVLGRKKYEDYNVRIFAPVEPASIPDSFVAEVDARTILEQEGKALSSGILFNASGTTILYVFRIFPKSQEFQLMYFDTKKGYTDIVRQSSQSILSGNSANRLKVERIAANQIKLYINNQLVWEGSDNRFTGGKVGFYSGVKGAIKDWETGYDNFVLSNYRTTLPVCANPALKQVIWRSNEEYYRYIPIVDGKADWRNPRTWINNSEYASFTNVSAVSHYANPAGSDLTKFIISQSPNTQDLAAGKYLRPPIENYIVQWTKTGGVQTLNLSGYPKRISALSTAIYDNNLNYKAIGQEGGVYYAWVRTVPVKSDKTLDWSQDSGFKKTGISHFPGTGIITAFNEEVYDGVLNQKLVRGEKIYLRQLPITDNKVNWSGGSWREVTSVANSGWPGTGTIEALSEYVDCKP